MLQKQDYITACVFQFLSFVHVMWFVEGITVVSVVISGTLKPIVGPCNHEQVLAKFVPVLPAYYVHFLVYLVHCEYSPLPSAFQTCTILPLGSSTASMLLSVFLKRNNFINETS